MFVIATLAQLVEMTNDYSSFGNGFKTVAEKIGSMSVNS